MPLQQTTGNSTADGFGGASAGAAVVPNYIEDVFSTYLYTGNGSTQTITNGIDLSTKGGLVWIKPRSYADSNSLYDTNRGVNNFIQTNKTDPEYFDSRLVSAFNADGFSMGAGAGLINTSAATYASWTFRKQPKFYTQGTFSGNGTSQTISHDLGSAPGCIFIKRTDASAASSWWAVYHRSLSNPNNNYLRLDSTNAAGDYGGAFISNVTSTSFDVSDSGAINISGGSYVYYAFAHNAGGFGLTGTDNVISCGSFTPDSSGNVDVNLGYEPQWILFKRSAVVGSWSIADTMRGMSYSDFNRLYANLSNAEDAQPAAYCVPTATGFKSVTTGVFSANEPHIYIAIRRGPMKVPTSGTSVFAPALGQSGNPSYITGFPVDFAMSDYRVNGANWTSSRLQGTNGMNTTNTDAEASDGSTAWDWMNGHYINGRTSSFISWAFRRAPSFFDEVCWTGTNANQTLTHNLTVVPELIIYKVRGTSENWQVNSSFTGSNYLKTILNLTNSGSTLTYAGGGSISAQPTATQFSVGQFYNPTSTMVAYLFATCAGVSKVGSYTGTGTTLQVNCGFTGGARFVLIKRTDSTGDWYVWDSARGIVSGNDPYLLLNSTAAEVTNTDYVDTYSAGFEISSTAPAAINASGGSFIFLAIA